MPDSGTTIVNAASVQNDKVQADINKCMRYHSVKLIVIIFVVEKVRSLIRVKDFFLLGAEY